MRFAIRSSLYVLIILILFEIFVRIFLPPFYADESLLFKFRTMHSGIEKGGVRIAMLGDSFTYGAKVEENETISFFLQEILKRRLTREDISVDNFGISGTSTLEHYFIFQKVIKGKNYDIVVLNFFIDDLTPYYYFNTLLNEYQYCNDIMSLFESLFGRLLFLRSLELLTVYIDIIRTSFTAETSLTPINFMIEKMREKNSLRYRCAKDRLVRLAYEIKEQKSIPVFLLIPSLTLYDTQNPYPEEIAEYETQAMLLAKKSGFVVVDALLELREQLNQRIIIKRDIHYNREGYKLLAESLSDKIIELLSGER